MKSYQILIPSTEFIEVGDIVEFNHEVHEFIKGSGTIDDCSLCSLKDKCQQLGLSTVLCNNEDGYFIQI